MSLLSGPGLSGAVGGVNSNVVALASGQQWTVGPTAGFYQIVLSKYHILQQYDPVAGFWRGTGSNGTGGEAQTLYSDGVSYRIANNTGSAVGALLTNAGSGYTSAPTVTPSAGNSVWRAIVGGAVSTSVTILNGGLSYAYAPNVWIAPPPPGGIQATATCTISNGIVNSVTIVDQGAGYVTPPQIVFINDPRELANPLLSDGYNASAALSLTGAGTVTGLVCTDNGQGNLATLPTLAFSGGGGSSAAATVIMNWTIASFAISTAGAGLAGTFAQITALDAFPTTAPAYTNPTTQSNLVYTRPATIKAAISAGALTLTGSSVSDGGAYTSSPVPLVLASASVVTTAPVVTFTMGGATGVSYVTPVGA